MTAQHEDVTTIDDDRADWYEPAAEELPPRPRRRLVTPATIGLSAVIVAAGGFFAGAKVQKAQGGGSGGAQAGLPSGFGARAGAFGGQGNGPAASGQVANKRGRTLYVTDSSGTTVKVTIASSAKVSRTANTSANAIHPGDTVIVQGTKRKNGTVAATQVVATAKNAATGGFGGPPAGG